MASVVFTQNQIAQIARFWVQQCFIGPNVTATMSLTDVQNAVSAMATSISIGSGTVSYNISFSPPNPMSSQSAANQNVLISAIMSVAAGVPLV